MRADDDVIPRRKQGVNDPAAVFFEDGALAPGRREQHRALMLRQRRVCVQPREHIIHVRDADLDDLLGGQRAQLFERAHLLDLILTREQDGVIVVDAEHPVAADVAGRVRQVDVIVDLLRALPLVDIQPRRRGQHDGGVEEIELGKGLVALLDELRMDVREVVFERGVVRRGGHVDRVDALFIELAAHGAEHAPIPLVIRKNDQRDLLCAGIDLFAAAEHEAQLQQPRLEHIRDGADDPDEDRKEHAARAGVNVKSHPGSVLLRLFLLRSEFRLHP